MQRGQTFAHFEVVRKLGEGGMGEVYLARDQKLNRQVAIKTLQEDFFDRPERKERFKREATTAASINHPNVTGIYDIGTAHDSDTDHDVDYIVMEYVQGTSLKKVISDQKFDMAATLRIAEKVAGGLAAAHKVNIVHRDLKPDNIIIDVNDEPKILDFGLAKPVDPVRMDGDATEDDTISKELTRQGTVVGTVSYMSPEQAQGQPVDSRSDVFSFGILLYRMATGELPFSGSTQVSILARILESQPEPPSTRNDAIPSELERIIDKCLQKDPNDRYQDTRDLVVDLRRLRRQYDSGVSESVSTITPAAKQSRSESHSSGKSKLLLVGLPLAAAIVIVLIVFAMTRSDGGISTAKASEPGLAILDFENKTGDQELDWLETGLPEILLTDLSQSGGARLISQRRVLDLLESKTESADKTPTHQEWVEAAKSLGATSILSGSFYKVGDLIRIDARVEDVGSDKILFGEKVVGTDPFILVDSLTNLLASAVSFEGLGPDSTSVASVTTSSPDAYKHYIQGLNLFLNGEHEKAIAEFNRAIEFDSTFALPYMRIGMAHVFQGRLQDGAAYLGLALQNKDRLPAYDRNLLDIYADLWLRHKFDDALTKLEVQVANYPEDKESKCVLALLYGQLTGDTTKAFALLDEVLAQDPGFQLALSWYADLYVRQDRFDLAIDYTRRLLKHHPESIEARKNLAAYYARQKNYPESIKAYEEILKDYPDDFDVLANLHRVSIRQRDFAKARMYLERIREAYGDDPYHMDNCYGWLSNLLFWKGKFKTGMTYRFKALESALETGDSTLIAADYGIISEYYKRFGMPDSAIYYIREGNEYSSAFGTFDLPMQLISIDTANTSEARPLFQEALNDLRGRVPQELFTLADALQDVFDAQATLDTAALIEAQRRIVQMQLAGSDINVQNLGVLQILYGQYEEGRERLKPFLSGENETTSGYNYPRDLYLVGVANHELGSLEEAEKNFTEFLSYWGEPEIALPDIKDARERLARLKSRS